MKKEFKTGIDFAAQDIAQDIIDSKGYDGEVSQVVKKSDSRYVIYYITYSGRECELTISEKEMIRSCERFGYEFDDIISDFS